MLSHIQQQVLDRYIKNDENDDESKALSNFDIDNKLDGKTKVLTYKVLHKINNIDELLEPYKNFVLLYMSKPNSGHWCCVLKHKDRIEFFDPYGGKNIPDNELDNIDDNVKIITNQNYPYLSQLLYDSNKKIEFNNYNFQQYKKDINTCGRHCIVRIMFKHLLLDDYYKQMFEMSNYFGLNYDQLVTLLTKN